MTGWFGGTPNLRNLQMKALSWRILVGHGSWKCVCFFTWRTLFQKYMFLIVYVLCVSIHLSIFPSFHLLIYSTIQLSIQISKDYTIIYNYTWFYIVTYWIWYMPIVYIHPLVHLQYPGYLVPSWAFEDPRAREAHCPIVGEVRLWRKRRRRSSEGWDWYPLDLSGHLKNRVLLKMAHWPIE